MNKCGALLNNAVNKDSEYFNVEKSLMDKWNRMVKTEFIYSYNKFSEFKKVITCFNRKGIQAVVLKGSEYRIRMMKKF